jgi:hypothetical protein
MESQVASAVASDEAQGGAARWTTFRKISALLHEAGTRDSKGGPWEDFYAADLLSHFKGA